MARSTPAPDPLAVAQGAALDTAVASFGVLAGLLAVAYLAPLSDLGTPAGRWCFAGQCAGFVLTFVAVFTPVWHRGAARRKAGAGR